MRVIQYTNDGEKIISAEETVDGDVIGTVSYSY